MRALECLVAVVERGSLTGAAARLHVSQPALSHQIGAIERELGTPVIERLARGIRPTAAGLAAVVEAKAALAAADRAVTAGRSAATGGSGRIRVACDETMTAWVLAPVLRSWRHRFPDVKIELSEYTSADTMLDVLLAGQADITVGPRPGRAEQHVTVLGHEQVMVVASPQHRFSTAGAVSLAQLTGEPLVHYHRGHGFGAWLDRLAAQRGVALPSPVLRAASTRTAIQLAAAGVGVTLAPRSALTPLPAATIKPLETPESRDIVVTIAAPHDHLIRRFGHVLEHHGLPDPGRPDGGRFAMSSSPVRLDRRNQCPISQPI